MRMIKRYMITMLGSEAYAADKGTSPDSRNAPVVLGGEPIASNLGKKLAKCTIYKVPPRGLWKEGLQHIP